ncbi:MAG TPA: hypothetical protein VJX67_27665 [Blastocatellia bacterium]|nr:hypothetical protein [Blastocatellia bacterium]
MNPRCVPAALGLLILAQLIPAQASSGWAGRQSPTQRTVVLTGTVACVDKSGHSLAADRECPLDPGKFVLTTTDGTLYSFLSTDVMTAMFTDTRVRQRLLRITALEHPGHQLEVDTVQSIKDGKLYDIYYYCDICNITEYAPGPCPCCRKELEFKETPASEP